MKNLDRLYQLISSRVPDPLRSPEDNELVLWVKKMESTVKNLQAGGTGDGGQISQEIEALRNTLTNLNSGVGDIDSRIEALIELYEGSLSEQLASNQAAVEQSSANITALTQKLETIVPDTTKVKGVMYWPRKSPFMDWWRELKIGTINWADVDADIAQMKSVLGINTIRVFTYYDYEYRKRWQELMTQGQTESAAKASALTTHFGWTTGDGVTFNQNYLDNLSMFIDKCAAENINVTVTMFQGLPALLATDDWSFLESDYQKYENFLTWMFNMLVTKNNVKIVNLINEPDGYGVWDDSDLAGRVLTFLSKLKTKAKQIAPDIKILVNTTTHDNAFKVFPSAPVGYTSVYELTDILAQNTFLWADTGYWSGQNYRTQCEFMRRQNVLNKPILLTECGFPAHYAQQDVAGSPKLNEDGSAAGGNATVTEESIVPQGGIFDRPKGVVTGLAHTPENQARSVQEGLYWAELYNFMGGLVWSAYDHANPEVSYVYRDAFGVIDKDGSPRPAANVLKYSFSNMYTGAGLKALSLAQGSVTSGQGSRINGLNPFNSAAPEDNTPAGIYIAPALVNGTTIPQTWTSDELTVRPPMRLRFSLTQRVTNTANQPLIIRVQGTGKNIDYRFKLYGRNTFQRLDSTSGDVDLGWAPDNIVWNVGTANIIEIDFTTTTPQLYVNGNLLVFTGSTAGEPVYLPYQMNYFKLSLISESDSDWDITDFFAVGAAGEAIQMNPRNKAVIEKFLAF